MIMEFSLNANKIAEIGEELSDRLHECGIDSGTTLMLRVSRGNMLKVDEDLFYRKWNNGENMFDGGASGFTPSETEITVNVGRVNIVIMPDDT